MSMEKGIEHNKEHRKPYHGSKAFDPSCRPHGSCGWCLKNRQYKNLKRKMKADASMEDIQNDEEREEG